MYHFFAFIYCFFHFIILITGALPAFFLVSYKNETEQDISNFSSADATAYLDNQQEDDTIQLNLQYLESISTDKDKHSDDPFVNIESFVNTLGINFCTTRTGSIKKTIFFDFLIHFWNNLPKGYASASGKWVILIMDFHGSRANAAALEWAYQNHILILILPSKTSIISQPNDNVSSLCAQIYCKLITVALSKYLKYIFIFA